MRCRVLTLLVLTLARSPVQAQEAVASSQPEHARLVTSDVIRFWEIFDRAADHEFADMLRSDYLEAGTQALRDFIPHRILSADSLAALVIRQRARYEAAREASLRVTDLEGEIRAAWYALKYLYPYATFPDTYFVIGRFFIAELVTGRPPSAPYMAYGYEHEAALWRELSEVLDAMNTGGWLYGGQPADRPADLGYFFGYRIAEAYYTTAQDKRKAVSDIINITDYQEFLVRSGYGPSDDE